MGVIDKTTYAAFQEMKSYCKECLRELWGKYNGDAKAYLASIITGHLPDDLDTQQKERILALVRDANNLNAKFFNSKLLPELLDIYDFQIAEHRNRFMQLTDKLYKVGLCLGTYNGITLGLEDFVKGKIDVQLPDPDQVSSDVVSVEATFKSALEQVEQKLKESDSHLVRVINSGARGKWEQVKQMLIGRGFVDAGDGRVLYIKGNYLDGLNPADMLLTGIGAIKAVYDKSVNTYRPGYLTRQLMYCAVSELVSEDCNSQHYATYTISNEKFAKALIGKYYLDEETNTLRKITKQNYRELIGKTLKFRSALYCNHRWHICKTCFGDTYVTRHYTRIATIMAQILGERATQLSMRAFHTGGSVSFTTEAATYAAEYPDYLYVEDKTIGTKKPVQVEIPETYLTATGIVLLSTTITLKYEDGTEIQIPLVKGDRLFVQKSAKLNSGAKIAELGIQHIGTQIAILESVLQRKDTVSNIELFTHMLYSLFADVADYDFGYFELLTGHLLWHNDKPLIAYTPEEIKQIQVWQKMPLKMIPHKLSWKRGFGYERLKVALEELLKRPKPETPDGFLEHVMFSEWPIDPFDIAERAKPDKVG